MRIGEVCLNTNDVLVLADFYKKLFGIDNGSNDETHQTLINDETQLTIYNDGTKKNNNNQNICLAFTVEDVEAEYEKLCNLRNNFEYSENSMHYLDIVFFQPILYEYELQ